MRHRHGRMRRYFGARLHRRLFMLLGASIMTTALVVGVVQMTVGGYGPRGWHHTLQQMQELVGEQFGEVWNDPPRRAHLATRLHDALGMSFELQAADGATLGRYGETASTPTSARTCGTTGAS